MIPEDMATPGTTGSHCGDRALLAPSTGMLLLWGSTGLNRIPAPPLRLSQSTTEFISHSLAWAPIFLVCHPHVGSGCLQRGIP